MESKNTVDAIYDMREAAEHKARVEIYATLKHTSSSRDELLEATLDLEAKTQDAIELCVEGDCAHDHGSGAPVIDLDAWRKQTDA